MFMLVVQIIHPFSKHRVNKEKKSLIQYFSISSMIHLHVHVVVLLNPALNGTF